MPIDPRALFLGRWRIVEMDTWGGDVLDLLEETHITFEDRSDGEIAFVSVKGWLDVRYGPRDGLPCAEFSWEGKSDRADASGRGWVVLEDYRLRGHVFIHCSDDSGFIAVPELVAFEAHRSAEKRA